MKKAFLILIAAAFLVTGCGESSEHTCVDDNHDHLCDVCNKKISFFTDSNNDFKCDVCSKTIGEHLSGLVIHQNPTRTTYTEGEKFDPTGMEVWGQYESALDQFSNRILPAGQYSYPTDDLVLGQTSVLITAGSKSATVTITVEPKSAGVHTETFVLSGDGFEQAFPGGTNFDTQKKVGELKDYIVNQCSQTGVLYNVSAIKAQSRVCDDVAYLQLGSSSSDGELSFISVKKVYSIQVTAMAYSNYDSYHEVWLVDRESHLFVDDTDFSLEVPEGNPSLVTLDPVVYEEGVKEFTLSTSLGRVFISSIVITWQD